jgi:L-asparagine oxygenase
MTELATAPVTSDTTIRLTDAEQHELAVLSRQLMCSPPRLVDDHEWVATARRLSCQIPLRLREAARHYRHDPGPSGLLVIGNLPIDSAALPPTPAVPDSAERVATGPAAIIALLALHIGEIVAYRQEKKGALVHNVVPVPGRERTQSNAGCTPLELHAENAFHPGRPDLVCLLCLRGDHDGAAGTVVSSIRMALPLLSPRTRTDLTRPRFVTASPPSFASDEFAEPHAVLDLTAADPDLRVDFAATRPLDPDGAAALSQLCAALRAVSRPLVLQAGEVAFLDNRIAVHGRTAFRPRYDGRDRWLHRTYIQLDRRRSRRYRESDGNVLI